MQKKLGPKLSIIIPTLNRYELLSNTLSLLLEQLHQSSIPIELLVSDNASTDNTPSLFCDTGKFNSVPYYRFNERVAIDDSFARSIGLTTGEFIVLFGDDDIPLPGFIFHISSFIEKYPDIGYVYVNRLIGDSDLNNCSEILHTSKPFGSKLISNSNFIQQFNHWPGFVSCLILSKSVWEKGFVKDNNFPGYNFLNIVYRGSHNLNVGYIGYPLVLQRRGVQSWKKDWPMYWLNSMPKLLNQLQLEGITTGALQNWQQNEVTHLRFIIDCFVAKAYNYRINSPFWAQSRYYQQSKLRKIASWLMQYFVPAFFAKFVYSYSKKMT